MGESVHCERSEKNIALNQVLLVALLQNFWKTLSPNMHCGGYHVENMFPTISWLWNFYFCPEHLETSSCPRGRLLIWGRLVAKVPNRWAAPGIFLVTTDSHVVRELPQASLCVELESVSLTLPCLFSGATHRVLPRLHIVALEPQTPSRLSSVSLQTVLRRFFILPKTCFQVFHPPCCLLETLK